MSIITLEALRDAACRVADEFEAKAAKAEADVARDLEYSAKHKQRLGDGYWKDAWAKRQRAVVARAMADAIAEALPEELPAR